MSQEAVKRVIDATCPYLLTMVVVGVVVLVVVVVVVAVVDVVVVVVVVVLVLVLLLVLVVVVVPVAEGSAGDSLVSSISLILCVCLLWPCPPQGHWSAL